MHMTYRELEFVDAIIENTTPSGYADLGEVLAFLEFYTPRQVHATIGSLIAKGAVTKGTEGRFVTLTVTDAGREAFERELVIERIKAIDAAMLANAY